MKKNSLLAQTTCFPSFGPVLFIIASRRYIYRSKMSLVPVRQLVNIKNTNYNLKKLTVVAPHMYIRSFNIPVTLLIDIKNANIKKKHLLMAQTARNALFGPLLLVLASRRYIHSSRMSLVPVRQLVNIKNANN